MEEALSGLPMTQTVWRDTTLEIAMLIEMLMVMVIVSGVSPGAAAYLASALMQKSLGAARTGLTSLLDPIYASVAPPLVLREPNNGYYLLGAAMVLPWIILASLAKKS